MKLASSSYLGFPCIYCLSSKEGEGEGARELVPPLDLCFSGRPARSHGKISHRSS
ncbi:hypothetical protein BDA96_10G341000 [Sorghum bicolor]|uniref:Uncharacterized protein n=1 Tax=Sorghum bicolor TaxID=4558 RepID=A0A921U2W0_SORBI|nr:hypothetical protein BDA96_10G341000 [Sorghum bicolor]